MDLIISNAGQSRWRRCVIPAADWDGDTGIPALLSEKECFGPCAREAAPKARAAEPRRKGFWLDEKVAAYLSTPARVRKMRSWADGAKARQCRCCMRVLPLESFWRNSRGGGRQVVCGSCRSAIRKAKGSMRGEGAGHGRL